jgi:glycosyltransferase involved in cell wall biosynthesis
MALIACVGSLTPVKNQPLVVEALARPGAPRNTGVMFIGEGSGLAVLEALARERGVADRVWCLGYQAAVPALLSKADLLVQASTSEGQGLVLLEAMRARVPIVASDIPVFRELVADGKTGHLFTPNDADALAGAISRTLQQSAADRKDLLDRARAIFGQRYTVTAMRRSHDALYELVAKTELPLGP